MFHFSFGRSWRHDLSVLLVLLSYFLFQFMIFLNFLCKNSKTVTAHFNSLYSILLFCWPKIVILIWSALLLIFLVLSGPKIRWWSVRWLFADIVDQLRLELIGWAVYWSSVYVGAMLPAPWRYSPMSTVSKHSNTHIWYDMMNDCAGKLVGKLPV